MFSANGYNTRFFVISRGHDFAMVTKKRAADLTKDMLVSGDWRNVEFKPYNFNTLGLPTGGGYFHPLLKARVGFLFDGNPHR